MARSSRGFKPKGFSKWSASKKAQYSYNQIREEWHQDYLKDLQKNYNKEMQKLYKETLRNSEKTVDAWLGRYGFEVVDKIESKRKVMERDIARYAADVKTILGIPDKYLPVEAKEKLRAYNLKMRLSRETYLQREIELELMRLANKELGLIEKILFDLTQKELRIQSGFMDMSIASRKSIRMFVEKLIEGDFNSARFSNTIWVNNLELNHILQQGISRSILRGENPTKWKTLMYKSMQKELLETPGVGNAAYKAKRLVVTETGRMQTIIAKEAAQRMGYTHYQYISEPTACPECLPLNGTIHLYKNLEQGTNAPMMHPFCMCSIANVFEGLDELEWQEYLEQRIQEIEKTL